MNIKKKRKDVINIDVVNAALDKGFKTTPTTSFEHFSMMETLDNTNLLKIFFEKYLDVIEGHFNFKPGSEGAKEAETSFDNNNNKGGRRRRTRKKTRRKKRKKKTKKRRKSRRRKRRKKKTKK